jgi:hypothetical protein
MTNAELVVIASGVLASGGLCRITDDDLANLGVRALARGVKPPDRRTAPSA